ncbi:hypothetical protein [Planomonospora venezuelensis]|uniref:ABC-type iron transport system FetAB permease component n=1 Tax=Planomonospora venezuelensis TaxID=1999 RepID=A0A841D8B1_PLAVE|nr:hypothetical protein [Planomonospora venezuelensis]MBB5966180.1 ABC-type iron transport system FetAB permease component [Planomonospora venezuelensis]GIN01957.1 hypothetical protein Pve01_36150 [Planomonospora venezuelensis]
MGRILLIVAAVVVAFIVLGWVLSFLVGLIKWALILGLVAAVVMFATRFFRRSPGVRG